MGVGSLRIVQAGVAVGSCWMGSVLFSCIFLALHSSQGNGLSQTLFLFVGIPSLEMSSLMRNRYLWSVLLRSVLRHIFGSRLSRNALWRNSGPQRRRKCSVSHSLTHEFQFQQIPRCSDYIVFPVTEFGGLNTAEVTYSADYQVLVMGNYILFLQVKVTFFLVN